MRALKRPDWDGLEDFDRIVESKHEATKLTLRSVRGKVELATRRYQKCAPDLESFKPTSTSEAEKKDLLACYAPNLRVKSCVKMLNRLRVLNKDRVRCPLCGVGTLRESWDHYLPKAKFPEFAVCVLNLVPVCLRCNSARRKWLVSDGRSTVHMYYDAIPQDVFLLEAEVSVDDDNTPIVRFGVDAKPDSIGFSGLFTRHCDALGLLVLFDDIGSVKLGDIAGDIVGRDLEPSEFAIQLETMGKRRGRDHGPNHWEAALYRGAARSPSFIAYLSRGGRSR